jgi:glycerophosphoryl diester phosphodiesterase
MKTLNIAHRGFTKNYPDNTIEAFSAAIKLGADGIECDVHETADNRFIIFHDGEIEGRPISEMSVSEVRQVRLRNQYKIPLLEETLELCHEKVLLNLELKRVYSLDRLLKKIQAAMTPEELLLSSFQSALITKLADMAPDLRRGILTSFPSKDALKLMSLTRAQVMLPMLSSANMALVDRLHHRQLSLIVWNCNTAEELRTALSWDVDGIITDNPDSLLIELRLERYRS